MRSKDFEIGKIYQGDHEPQHNTYFKIDSDTLVSLSTTYAHRKVDAKSLGFYYKEITFDDLNEIQKATYLKYFPKQQSCTCDIQDIMTKGCTCGWLEKERS